MQADQLKAGALLLGVAVAGFLAWRLVKEGGGLVTGHNVITETATNAEGERTTAYEGAGIVGTVGAATNAASGGNLASWGESLGSWVYDLTHEEYNPNAPAPAFTGGASGSW